MNRHIINMIILEHKIVKMMINRLTWQLWSYLALNNVKQIKLSFFDQFSENCRDTQSYIHVKLNLCKN